MNLSGVLTPIPTPFTDNDEPDVERLHAALAHWVKTPLAGFVVLGSNGEAALLEEDESDRVVGAARDAVPRGRAFIVGTGRESTRATIHATRRAASLGADAVLVRTPGFFKSQMTAAVFVTHYSAVADAAPVPVLLYNFTAVTGVTLPIEAAAQLADHPNIIGMKESNSDIVRVSDLISATRSDFKVLAGSAATFHEALRVGASGGILALGSVLPEACVRLFELTKAERLDEARAVQQELIPIAKLLGGTYGVPALKAALKLVGWDVGDPRPPLLPLHEAAVSELADALSPFHEIHGHVAS
jgi:4-hydroxy-2-oxoglutarate aldolase